MKVILEAHPDDMILALRAAQWLQKQPARQKDAVLAYGEEGAKKIHFYVRRGKSAIIVRPC